MATTLPPEYLTERNRGRIDWWGNLTFAGGLAILLTSITFGIQPAGGHAMGWQTPKVIGGLALGIGLLLVFCLIESIEGLARTSAHARHANSPSKCWSADVVNISLMSSTLNHPPRFLSMFRKPICM